MTREVWCKLPGTSLAGFTVSARYWQPADSVATFDGSSAPANTGDSYAARIRAYITAPVSGAYTFWIASDDESELYLSTDASKFNRVKIASIIGWVPANSWDSKSSQKSAPIHLEAGQRYFIEALHKEGGLGDHCSIAWQTPGGERMPVPASALESFTADPNDLDNDGFPDDWEAAHDFSVTDHGSLIAGQGPLEDPDHDGYSNVEEAEFGGNPWVRGGIPGCLLLETWRNVSGSQVEDLRNNAKFAAAPTLSEFVFSAETPGNRAENFGARMRGYVIAPLSGEYTFYVAGDDNCELWLSDSESQFGAAKIASLHGKTSVRQWTKYPSQKSEERTLVAGRKYYIEALLKENVASDHLEVGWRTPGSSAIEVIPGSVLESYAYDAEDPDGDNMPTDWEVVHGLDPVTIDAAADPDEDGVPNHLEYIARTDPHTRSIMHGGLLHELWLSIPGHRVRDLIESPKFLRKPDIRNLVGSSQTFGHPYDAFGNRLRGYLTAPVTGSYTFWAMGNDETELWFSTSASQFDKQLLVRPTVVAETFDVDLSQKSRSVTLVAGERYYLEILHKESHGLDFCRVAWQQPGGTREIIPGSVLSTFTPTADDQDDDGLPDAWEAANGLSPRDNGSIDPRNGARGDLDGEGLDNVAEWRAGTRADLSDSDGDGVSDRDEIEMMETQALTADAHPFETVATIPGSAFLATSGSWIKENGKARQDCVRGWLEYPVQLPVAGVYQLDLAFTPVIDTGVSPDYEVVFSADGHSIQRVNVKIAQASSGRAKVLTPWLAAGSHTIRVFIDNSYWFRRVTVDRLEVLAARGPDADANRTPDWIDQRIAKQNSFEAPAESLTSPVCLEGKARWSELTTIGGTAVQTAPDDRWYADVPLHPTQSIEVTASLENGALTAIRNIDWIPTNLLTTRSLNIRLGDSLKLTAFSGTSGTSDEVVSITLEGRTTEITADQPLVHCFTVAGKIPIQISHRQDGYLTTATATFNVVASPVTENATCVVGSYRELPVAPLPSGVVLQFDRRIDVRSKTRFPAGSEVYSLRIESLADRPVAFRLSGHTGPILGQLILRPLRLRRGSETTILRTTDLGNNTFRYKMPMIIDGTPGLVTVKARIFIAGVVFDSGKTEEQIEVPLDLDVDGFAFLEFIKTGTAGANCHRIEVIEKSCRIAYID